MFKFSMKSFVTVSVLTAVTLVGVNANFSYAGGGVSKAAKTAGAGVAVGAAVGAGAVLLYQHPSYPMHALKYVTSYPRAAIMHIYNKWVSYPVVPSKLKVGNHTVENLNCYWPKGKSFVSHGECTGEAQCTGNFNASKHTVKLDFALKVECAAVRNACPDATSCVNAKARELPVQSFAPVNEVRGGNASQAK